MEEEERRGRARGRGNGMGWDGDERDEKVVDYCCYRKPSLESLVRS